MSASWWTTHRWKREAPALVSSEPLCASTIEPKSLASPFSSCCLPPYDRIVTPQAMVRVQACCHDRGEPYVALLAAWIQSHRADAAHRV
jgi:hypothetical protein